MPKKAKNIVAAPKSNLALTVDIANALANHILAGKPLYPRDGILLIEMADGSEEILSVGTVNSWVGRNVIIPSTNKTLREVIDTARETYRIEKRKKNHEVLIDTAEKEFGRTLKLRTSEVRRNMFGQIMKNEDGSISRKENPQLLRIKMQTAQFVTERLDPQTYGKVEKTENKHLVFSLADLRKEEQRQNEAAQDSLQ